MTERSFNLSLNGEPQMLTVDDEKPLLWVLRDELKSRGTKFGCGRALCGACTVHVDGQPTRSCVMPSRLAEGKEVSTIESVSDSELGRAIQRAWYNLNVPQCGYCQSGQIMASLALLRENPNPTDDDIDEALSGNICRCGMYPRIRKAIHAVASGEYS